ncbi:MULTISPECIES: class I SAM-dependent methyltransferase [unclassified Coleofasciculus]|uniref:class I SAM-dependent methyltransferase n=1 Tax=unclassified Coleofasciculus TaxID=2692782 RepID=UPI00187DDE5F|nr:MULTISPECIES: class I SAM-dependent methyltransferase [unclassified Coleofasciculus]MBE9126149.1 methyltransferase domain-containing protein [Coleofasciculus sp. LEGE 07081]MBE9149567.1 methyltransferase domain-containing protein [Coleofasciculus sp. LEGE 07092]
MISTSSFPETADIETSSDDYATRFTGEIGAWLLKVQEEATLKMLAPYPNANILEVGGGHGQLTGALIQNGYHVTVLGSAEICKARIQPFIDANQCSFNVGNILDLPYGDRAFDVVISYRLLAHVTQWQKFLAELARVADKAVIVDYPTVRSVNYIAPYLFKFKKGLEGNTRPFTCYKESEIIDYFKSLELTATERYPQFFLPMVLHRALKSPRISSASEKLTRFSGFTKVFGSPVILKLGKK